MTGVLDKLYTPCVLAFILCYCGVLTVSSALAQGKQGIQCSTHASPNTGARLRIFTDKKQHTGTQLIKTRTVRFGDVFH